MMHGREKSDSAIVAGKPTNKAVPTAAEPVERRAGAKGNASQQSTDRAQNRATVSQALERIRKVAKERKKERFIALFHHISIDLLDEAFYELKENAAAGVDGLTWRDYEQLEADHKVVDVAHQSGFAPQPALHHALEPEVEHIMEIEVAQQHADRSALRCSFFAFLRGHYAYYGVAGNLRCLAKVYRPWSVTGVGCCAAAAEPRDA